MKSCLFAYPIKMTLETAAHLEWELTATCQVSSFILSVFIAGLISIQVYYLKGWGKAGEGEGVSSDPTGQPWALRQAVLPLVADQDCQVLISRLQFCSNASNIKSGVFAS